MDGEIGITERGDAALDLDWKVWVRKGNPAILLTKNPYLLYQQLDNVPTDRLIVHCTITGYGGSLIEPHAPAVEQAIHGYRILVELHGGERTVLRIDPVFPWPEGLDKALDIASEERGRVRVSFLDNYRHVAGRFIRSNIAPPPYEFHASQLSREFCLRKITEVVGHNVEVCGEPGLPVTGCVSEQDAQILGVPVIPATTQQRPSCKCLGNKKELLKPRQQCAHSCAYCYWK